MKTGKWLGILLVSTLMLGGCARAQEQETIMELKDSALTAPQTTQVVRGDIEVVTYYDAYVGPKVEQLTFAEEGTFGEFFVQLGDTVQAGDILASPALENVEKAIEDKQEEIDGLTRQYEYEAASLEADVAIVLKQMESVNHTLAQLDAASAEYQQVRRQLGNYDEQRQRLELQLRQLRDTYHQELPYYQAQLEELQQERDGNHIVAPFDGTVIALDGAQYGNSIDTDQYYVAIADTSVYYARCESISITILNFLEKVEFWMDGDVYEATHIPMSHDYYMATQNSGEQAYSEFEIAGAEGAVSHGDYGKIKLVSKSKEDVLMVPETVVQSSGGSYYVYKDADGKRELVNVTIGISDGIHVEIVEGLEEGDVIYVQV